MKNKSVKWGMTVLVISIVIVLSTTGVYAETIRLRVKGSTTLYPIIESSMAQFEADSAHLIGAGNSVDIELEPPPGSGSGGGITALCRGEAEVAMSSRKIRTTDCTGTTWGHDDLEETVLARDAVSVIVHRSRTVTCVRKSQLKALYETNPRTMTWAMLGDTSPRSGDLVVPRARILGSGTRDAFNSMNGIGDAAEQTVINATGQPRLQGNPEMINAIATMPQYDGLGYVGIGFNEDHPHVKAIAYDAEDGRGCIQPNDTTILQGTYGMVRDLYLYTLSTTATPSPGYSANQWAAIRAYLNWMKGPFGQRYVADADFVMVQRPAFDLNNNGQVEVGDMVVLGKFYLRRWRWWPY